VLPSPEPFDLRRAACYSTALRGTARRAADLRRAALPSTDLRRQGVGEHRNLAGADHEPPVGERPGQARRALGRVDRRARRAAPRDRDVARMPHGPRQRADDVGIERDDHRGVAEAIHRLDRFTEREP